MASRQILTVVKGAAARPLIAAGSCTFGFRYASTAKPSITLSQKQRPKRKKPALVKKPAVDQAPGDTRLRALFSRPSTSKAPAPIDETTLLKVIRPVFDKDPTQLDPFLYDIAINLYSARPRPLADEQYITSILAYCWVRANIIKSDRFTSSQLVEIARRYARRLIRLATYTSDSPDLLSNLEENLEVYRTGNFMLPPAIYAAWAVLRHESGQKEVVVRFIPAKKEVVFKAFRDLLADREEDFEKYTPAIEELLLANEGGTHDLPSSPDELDSMLGAMRIGQQTGEVVRLWGKYKERMMEDMGMVLNHTDGLMNGNESASTGIPKRGTTEMDKSILEVKDQDEIRDRKLASFLRFFSRSSATRRLPAEERDLATYREEVLSFLPKPYPPSIHHALLVHHARIDDEIRPISEVQELDDDIIEIRDRQQVYSQLENTWAAAGKEGARDLKSYMLYMEGLAKLGEAKKLGHTWEELVRDQACKEMYLKEETSTFPPTRALNHMISCAFLIPNEGTSIALDLFSQASRPESAIPCNIITINTVLRHYARRGVVDSMLALFPLAEQLKLKPDVVTYTVLIQGLLRAREIKMAAKTLETMQKQGISPNERTISLLISDLAKEGDRRGLRAAEDLMKEMRKLNMRVGEVPWTSLISGYFRGGWDGDAWTAIKRMEEDQVALNRIGYNMVLRELGKRVRPPRIIAEEGQSLLWEMFRRMIEKITPNSDTYLIVLSPLVKAKRWDEADGVVKEMKDRGFVPEKSALRAVLNRVKLRKTQWD